MKRWVTVLLSFLLLPMLLLAGTTGKIKGKIVDQTNGEPLIGASVIIVGTSFGAISDMNGEYSVSNLTAGTYSVKASYIGYQPTIISNVRVNVDLTTDLNFKLNSEGIAVGEVLVVSERLLINKSNTNAIRATTSEVIDALPVRGLNNIISLTPGVVLDNGSVFVRGGRVDEVGYYLEGTNITNPVLGGRGLTIVQDAIEEVQVQAGGYTAEFGGANAGIIRTQLKSGTSDLKISTDYVSDNLSFKSKSNRFNGNKSLGAYIYGYNEFTGTISGPIVEHVKVFALFNSNWQLDRNPLPYPGINLGVITDPNSTTPSHNSIELNYPAGPTYRSQYQGYTGTGTVTFDFNPFIFRATGSYTTSEQGNGGTGLINSGHISSILNTGRLGITDQSNAAFSGKITHILNPTTYYEISGGYTRNTSESTDPLLGTNWKDYGDSIANANVGAIWNRTAEDITSGRVGRYRRPTPYDILGFSFSAPNDVITDYTKTKREELNFSASFSTELNKMHSIKVGGELSMYTIRSYFVAARSYAQTIYNNNQLANPDPYNVVMQTLTNGYGYDLDGNEISSTFDGGANVDDIGLLAPKRPVFAGVYFQDKIEYKNLILNVGLRYDYIDVDNISLIDPSRPETAFDFATGKIDPKGLKKTSAFSSLSPRLGFSFPVTEQTVFHTQFGKFVQQSRLRDLYGGMYGIGSNLRGGLFIGAPTGWDVRPTRTTQYEVGFTQQISDFISFDITGYYKDVQGQVEFDLQPAATGSPFQAYNVLKNGDFATTKGIEVSFTMRRIERLQVNGSISFQNALGTGSNANSHAGIVGAPLDGVTVYKPATVEPLDFNKAITGNINLDYRFAKSEESSILRQLGLSLLLTFDSGHPFTLGRGKGNTTGSLEGDARFRSPIEALNSSTTPFNYQLDLRIDKTFSIMDKLSANVYLFVINVLDTKNIKNVFLRTGSATDDGYLTDPTLGGSLHPDQRADYEAMYKAINIDYAQGYQGATGNYIYGPPRQVRFGIRLEY